MIRFPCKFFDFSFTILLFGYTNSRFFYTDLKQKQETETRNRNREPGIFGGNRERYRVSDIVLKGLTPAFITEFDLFQSIFYSTFASISYQALCTNNVCDK